jgi:hypothetical protein
MMPKVLNKYKDIIPKSAVYIGRPGKWGNPFSIGKDGNRNEVILKYIDWIATQHELLNALGELRGRDLVCFCHPLACHGDVLTELANIDIALETNNT